MIHTLPARQTIALATLTTALVLAGCSPALHDAAVATVGRDPITLGDYEKMYAKSNGGREAGASAGTEDRQKFLDLMVKYRLKLADAYRQGLDRRPEVVGELDQYKWSLASSYLTDRMIVTPGVRRMYDRRGEEIRASHVLLELSATAGAAETTEVYQKARDIVAQARAGTDFGDLAKQYSRDPSAEQNRGDLYYFSGGQMVGPFEDAAYATAPGAIALARTQYGLHVIKVVDRRPAPGEMRAGHIMVRFASPTPTPEDTLAAFTRIAAILDSLKAGGDFAGLAERNSQDVGSASRGGDLGWFTRRRWIQPFDEAALKLAPGQVSPVVRTVYGYHIIKCFETRPRKSFDESRQELRQLYQQVRFPDDYARFLDSLKRDLRFSRTDSIVSRFLASLDSTKTTRDSAWAATVPAALGRSAMMSVAGGPVSVDSVVSLIRSRQDLSNVSLGSALMLPALDKVAEQVVFAAKAAQLERGDPEFAAIVREYKEGILLYQVEQDNVWNRIVANDSTLRLYFDANREKFTFPDRVRFTEIRSVSSDGAQTLRSRLAAGETVEGLAAADSARMAAPTASRVTFAAGSASLRNAAKKSLASFCAELLRDPSVRLQITAPYDSTTRKKRNLALAEKRLQAIRAHLTGALTLPADRLSAAAVPRGRDASRTNEAELLLSGRVPLVAGRPEVSLLAPAADERAARADSLAPRAVSAPFPFRGSWSVVRLDAREPARQKTYEEAGAEVSTSFQDFESKRLEAEWIGRLKRDFPVVENREMLQKAFTTGP